MTPQSWRSPHAHGVRGLALLCLCITCATAQSTPIAARLDSCVHFYESGEYLKAIDSLNPIFPVLSVEQEQRAYKYLALSYAMLQMTGRAQMVYASGLDRYPNLRIDSLEVPPRVWTLFEETRLAHETSVLRPGRMRRNLQLSMASLMLAASTVGLWAGGYITGSEAEPAARWGGMAVAGVSVLTGGVSVAILAKTARPSARRNARP